MTTFNGLEALSLESTLHDSALSSMQFHYLGWAVVGHIGCQLQLQHGLTPGLIEIAFQNGINPLLLNTISILRQRLTSQFTVLRPKICCY